SSSFHHRRNHNHNFTFSFTPLVLLLPHHYPFLSTSSSFSFDLSLSFLSLLSCSALSLLRSSLQASAITYTRAPNYLVTTHIPPSLFSAHVTSKWDADSSGNFLRTRNTSHQYGILDTCQKLCRNAASGTHQLTPTTRSGWTSWAASFPLSNTLTRIALERQLTPLSTNDSRSWLTPPSQYCTSMATQQWKRRPPITRGKKPGARLRSWLTKRSTSSRCESTTVREYGNSISLGLKSSSARPFGDIAKLVGAYLTDSRVVIKNTSNLDFANSIRVFVQRLQEGAKALPVPVAHSGNKLRMRFEEVKEKYEERKSSEVAARLAKKSTLVDHPRRHKRSQRYNRYRTIDQPPPTDNSNRTNKITVDVNQSNNITIHTRPRYSPKRRSKSKSTHRPQP
ncbi:MAG: hypothetical protein JOS17DRAFT_226284, partial [Linnemannia elongata]